MTKLVWDNLTPRYESGIDRGVLYPPSGPGVLWNGLISIDHAAVSNTPEPLYLDGQKYLDATDNRIFQAILRAYSSPEEFGPCMGLVSPVRGLVLTRQPKTTFGLSYRTLIGDGLGYRLHLVYNATATLNSGRTYDTISDTPSAETLAWTIDAVPPANSTYKATAHFAVDSTKVSSAALSALENILYGTATVDPALPSVATLIGLF